MAEKMTARDLRAETRLLTLFAAIAKREQFLPPEKRRTAADAPEGFAFLPRRTRRDPNGSNARSGWAPHREVMGMRNSEVTAASREGEQYFQELQQITFEAVIAEVEVSLEKASNELRKTESCSGTVEDLDIADLLNAKESFIATQHLIEQEFGGATPKKLEDTIEKMKQRFTKLVKSEPVRRVLLVDFISRTLVTKDFNGDLRSADALAEQAADLLALVSYDWAVVQEENPATLMGLPPGDRRQKLYVRFLEEALEVQPGIYKVPTILLKDQLWGDYLDLAPIQGVSDSELETALTLYGDAEYTSLFEALAAAKALEKE